jgi:hypothetical protein
MTLNGTTRFQPVLLLLIRVGAGGFGVRMRFGMAAGSEAPVLGLPV